jgi:hypothetical protein
LRKGNKNVQMMISKIYYLNTWLAASILIITVWNKFTTYVPAGNYLLNQKIIVVINNYSYLLTGRHDKQQVYFAWTGIIYPNKWL